MFCDKCGTKIESGSGFCPNCGNKLNTDNGAAEAAAGSENEITGQLENSPQNKLTAKQKGKLVILAIIVVVVVIASMIFNSKSLKISKYLSSGETASALELYNESFDYGESNPLLNHELKKVINNTLESFKNSEISYDEAWQMLNTIQNMGINALSEVLSEAQNEAEDIDIMAQARACIENDDYADYLSAYHWYLNISENSTLYEEAQEEAEKAKNALIEESINKIDEIFDKDYIDAIYLDQACDEVLVKDYIGEGGEKITEKFCERFSEYITDLLNEDDYSEAETMIERAVNYLPDVKELSEISDGLEASYEKIALEKAAAEFEQQNYEKAAATVEAALAQNEDSTALAEKYKEYKSYLPAFINELDYFNKNGSIYDNYSKLSDNTGKAYKRIYCIDGWGKDTYFAEYLINGVYTNFEGVTGVAYDERTTEDSKFFEVYGDGILLYTSPTFKASSLPQEFNIDITGVKILKISYPKTDGSNEIASIFDGRLYNSSYLNNNNGEETTDTTE